MNPRRSSNLEMLAVVARALQGLKERVVFVGGSTIELYVPPSGPEGRATDDVDCVVEMTSRVKYHELEEELRRIGFRHVAGERVPICRWEYSGIPVDIMPTGGEVFGFRNSWYADGVANARPAELPDGQMVRIFSVPYLLASKIEAFQDRGRGDFLGSRDMEDIVTVLDGCPSLEEEMEKSSKPVQEFLTRQFREFLQSGRFVDSLQGHIEAVAPRTGRAEKVLELLRRLTARS